MLVYQRVIVIEWDLVGFNGDWMGFYVDLTRFDMI